MSATTINNSIDGVRRLGEAVLANAEASPDSPAITEDDTTWTYAQLAAVVRATAGALRAAGVRPGDRMMIIGENGLELAALIMAAGLVDAWAVLENARRASHEVDVVRDHCMPRRIFYVTSNSPDAAAHASRHMAREQGLGPLAGVVMGELTEDSVPEPVFDGAFEQVAALIYTTGTTGAPKGVMLTHGNLLYLAAMMQDLREVTAHDNVYGVLPITHVMGLGVVFLGTLVCGAHLYIVPRFDAQACLLALRDHRITMLQGAPAMFSKLLYCARKMGFAIPKLRFIGAGGAPLDPALKQETESAFGLPLHNGYGLTEASALCGTRIGSPRHDTSIGLPIHGVELMVLDAQDKDVPQGEVGELWARGPNVMKGYFRDAALTASVTRPGGWFNTQDLARRDEEGYVFIAGRAKDMIIASGFNVYPIEVEMALNAHEAVVHSAVIGRSHNGNEQIVAFIELAKGGGLTAGEMKEFLSARLSPYKRPTEIFCMSSLPVSPNGKVLKKDLHVLAQDVEHYLMNGVIGRLPAA